MADKTPMAPATETGPQTESLGGYDPLPEVDQDPYALPEPVGKPSEEEQEEGLFDWLWDDDDDKQDVPSMDSIRVPPSKKEFGTVWSAADKADDPNEVKRKLAGSYSVKKTEELLRQADEESHIVEKKRDDGEESFQLLPTSKEAFLGAVEAGSKAIDYTSETYDEFYEELPSPAQAALDLGGDGVDKVISFGSNFVLPALELFDTLRSETWARGYQVGSLLPDTGTVSGDALEDAFSTAYGLSKSFERLKRLQTFDTEEQELNYKKDTEIIGRKIYSALADGKLIDAARQREGWFLDRPEVYGLLTGANPTGEDLFNLAFPIDEMRRLHANSPKSILDRGIDSIPVDKKYRDKIKDAIGFFDAEEKDTNYWVEQLSDPMSRMGWGLALEATLDPLWLLGPAKGTQVAYRGTSYFVNNNGSRAIGILENYTRSTRTTHRGQTVVEAVVGSGDDAVRAQAHINSVADIAAQQSAQSQRRADGLFRLAELAEQDLPKALAALKNNLQKEIKALERSAKKYSTPRKTKAGQRRSKAAYEARQKKIQEIQQELDDLTRFGDDPVRVQKSLINMARKAQSNAMAHKGAASELRSFVEMAKQSVHIKDAGITEKSLIPLFGTWHVPTGKTTYSIGTKSQVEPIAKYANQALEGNDFLVSSIRKTKDAFKKVSPKEAQLKLDNLIQSGLDGKVALQQLSRGERFLLAASSAGVELRGFSYAGIDILANWLGTRRWNPWSAHNVMKGEMQYYGSREAFQIGLTGSQSRIVALKRLRPDLWENYQNSVTNYMNKLDVLQSGATRDIAAIYKLAHGVDGNGGALAEYKIAVRDREIPKVQAKLDAVNNRIASLQNNTTSKTTNRELEVLGRERAKLSFELEDLKAVLSDDYDVHKLLDEVANLIETGAGRLDEMPWLKAVADKWKATREDLASKLKVETEQIDQALVAMSRFYQGDQQAAEAIARQIEVIAQVLEGRKAVTSTKKMGQDELINALATRLPTKNELLNTLSEKKLAEVLYKTLSVSEGRPYGQEVAQAIDNALLEALGGNRALADKILDLASGVYATTPEEALLLFARDVSGEYKFLKQAIDAGYSPKVGWERPRGSALVDEDTPRIHPNRRSDHPEVAGLSGEMTIDEFIVAIKDRPVEYGAVYDGRNMLQVASKRGTKDSVPGVSEHIDVNYLDPLVQSGEVIFVHNHPSGWGRGLLAEVNKGQKLFSDKELKFVLGDGSESIGPSFSDLMHAMTWNAKESLVVQPNGTMWIIRRPANGWPIDATDSFAARSKYVEETYEVFNAQMIDAIAEAQEEANRLAKIIGNDFADLVDAFNQGHITKRQYDQLSKAQRKDAINYIITSTREELNAKAADIFESVFQTRPQRARVPGTRYESSPPIRKDPDTGDIVVERNYLGSRIREAIRKEKLETKAALAEIKNYRLNFLGFDDLIFSQKFVRGLNQKRYHALQQEVESFVAKHWQISAPDEVAADAELFIEALNDWVRTDYTRIGHTDEKTLGTIYKNNQRISRNAKEWLAEKTDALEIPNTVTEQDIHKLLWKTIWARNSDISVREKLSVLSDAEKKLSVKRTGKSPLSKPAIKKEATAIQTERINNVLDEALKQSGSVEEATKSVRNALDEIMDTPDGKIFSQMKDEMAKKIAHSAYSRKHGVKSAVGAARKTGRKFLKEELGRLTEELKETIPRMVIPDAAKGEDIVVHLKDWELRVWDEFKELHGNLSDHEMMLAAYAALGDSPKFINEKTVGKPMYDAMKGRYKQLVGKRFGELPEELVPLKEAFQSLIKHYEDLYIKHGMHFAKTPTDMLRLWGVVDYVPHTPLPPKAIYGEGLTDAFLIENAAPRFNTTLEKSFSTGMDQRKARMISGTMAEINDITKSNDFVLGIAPSTLLARYLKAGKAISNQELMFSLVAGGVIRPISSKPVYENALEVIAKKRRLAFDDDIESMSVDALEQLVRANAKESDIKILDNLLPTRGTGEMVPAALRAADMQYVPMFNDASKLLSNDLLMRGNIEAWLADKNIIAVLDEVFEEVATYSRVQREDKFAKLSRDAPIVRQADEIISTVGAIRTDGARQAVAAIARGEQPEPLFNAMARYQELLNDELSKMSKLLGKKGKSADEIRVAITKQKNVIEERAWNALAKEINGKAKDLNLDTRIQGGKALKTFYAQGSEMWNLYVPASVRKSLNNLFVPKPKGAFTEFLKVTNNFYKLRVTIIAAAFHARNHVSNKFSNILGVGVFDALDPQLSYNAGHLAVLVNFKDRYGSIAAAKRALSAPRGATESSWRYKKRQSALKLLEGMDDGTPSFDLGDGIWRTSDEALGILEEHSVISGSLQQFVDVNMYENTLANVYNAAGLEKNLSKAKRFFSGVEDGLIVGIPNLIAGTILPIGLPKNVGAGIGRLVENQARLINFQSNVRAGKGFAEAADQANKFLFNYRDLTAAQKDWMRLIFPFFTWTQKNIALQLKMMKENPVFYSQFQRMLIHQGPEIIEKYNAEQSGETYTPVRSASRKSLAFRDDHARNFIRIPVPGYKGYYIEGLGLPQEALFDQFEMISNMADLNPLKGERLDKKKKWQRFLGQTHFITKLMYEGMFAKHNMFMDMPISEMTNARFAGQVFEGFRGIPFAGPALADALEEQTGFTTNQYWNSRRGEFMTDLYIDGTTNWMLQSTPWSRLLKDAAASSMMYNTTYLDRMDPSLRHQYLDPGVDPLPDRLKLLDTMTGIRIIAENPAARKRRFDYDRKKREQEAYKRAGVTGQFPIEYIKEQ